MPLQGVTNGCALTQGVASLALGYALVGLSARLELNPKLEKFLQKINGKQNNNNGARNAATHRTAPWKR